VTILGALLGAILAALPAGTLTWLAGDNLSTPERLLLTSLIGAVSALTGLVVGAAVTRRVRYEPYRLVAFTGLASSFGGGLIGAACSAGITAAYLAAYGAWPSGIVDDVLFVFAIPAFAALGWFTGAAAGVLLGLASGTILRGLTALRR
jgi:hypothetical protein